VSTLGTLRILRHTTHIPPSGAWYGTYSLDASTPPIVGPTIITIGDLVLPGAVIQVGHDDHPGGALVAVTARGGAGWRLPVTHQGRYTSAQEVRLSTVLQDLASMAGEPYVSPGDLSLGMGYEWQAHEPLAPVHLEDVLAELVTRGFLPTWRVEPFTGLTRFDAWPSLGPADGRGRITRRNLARGRRTVELDVQIAAFLPGSSIEGALTYRTLLTESASELRAEVYEQ
jgi:hypothetical protein